MQNYKVKTNFNQRHIGPSESEIKEMLKEIGVASVEKLIEHTIPQDIRLKKDIELDEPLSENKYHHHIQNLAGRNKVFRSFIGLGYHPNILPPVIKRNILENPGWYTAYTPYQAEISQGRLEALLNFQTVILDLTSMEIANASLLDEGTAAAEAMIMFYTLRPKNRLSSNVFFISEECYPQTIEVIKTRAVPLGIEVVIGNHRNIELNENIFGMLLQYPSGEGQVYDYTELISNANKLEILTCVAADLLSLTLLKPPGEMGADCVVGTSQRFGIPMGFGGPHAAFFATRDKYKRFIPGRIIGLSVDVHGNKALRMALQTREQHIKRDKATSNICTAQVLLAVIAGMYSVFHGPEGLKAIADRIHKLAILLNNNLKTLGIEQSNRVFFDTLKINIDNRELIERVREEALKKEMNFWYGDSFILVSINQVTELSDIIDICSVFAVATGKEFGDAKMLDEFGNINSAFPAGLRRESKYLEHPVFHIYRSETKLLRYMKQLENKDLSLVHSMIPLGSCTMKLNGTTEMEGISLPEFADIHPFVPDDQAKGFLELINKFERDLAEVTGFAGVSLQPNSGAQGEYTGLLVIRAFHKSRGVGHRNICLIPSSAHGTNPASAVMAGMKVVVVKCDEYGNIDVDDLRQKAESHKDDLAALMVTYPSTHGVFESKIREICEIIHDNGGQVYMDGANMNAQVGLTSPAMIGADVCHLNLHKTFCIPHGGGGPGVGPVAVAEHLVEFLPGHSLTGLGSDKSITAVSSAPYGSALILLISYAYIRLMGAKGLKQASEIAILNANYIKSKLKKYYKVLYTSENGTVAHELIFDTREFKQSCKIEVEDIAKRLMDYGFHAPTVSFPVPGTMMVEPTESESKDELDRFCDALISIREEIKLIEDGAMDINDNPLKNAPHTAYSVISDNWSHSYSREIAAYPVDYLKQNKFWPSVGRIDSAYGDRNLVCSCPSIESYEENIPEGNVKEVI
ncbi:MAG: glycine dehydrogenase [Chlorobi bacterium OLB4]|jgi:glycine dehydrogenase|nr:MAG: glycine dehydrogenase [Chlorobi bacterium OLB4]MBW7856308.1 aminomethyl-transferring glycine dehydrogenase [Ignavibacteria bacterium]OQY78907.1 MAG: glycine dehydrogenase (aminomethyl-transferring) [Ignavibacteriales bacterium UTCHB1]